MKTQTTKVNVFDIKENSDLGIWEFISEKYGIDESTITEDSEIEISLDDAIYIGRLDFYTLTEDGKIAVLQSLVRDMAKSIISWQKKFNDVQDLIEQTTGQKRLKVLIVDEETLIQSYTQDVHLN